MSKYKVNGLTATVPHPPNLRPLDEYNGRRRKYELLTDFVIIISAKGVIQEITVKRGFKTDLASIPIFAQLILGNHDSYLEPALVHDMLCDNNVERWYTNLKMREIMIALKYPLWKRLLVYYGLVFFGYKSLAMKLFKKVWAKS